ncbi:MAG: hypothetical protein JXB03_08380 [Spirochaetales bacterium]|nr:hypothetical protein [Spirochaetales bacterium]
MKDNIAKYLSILKIELLDLEEDVSALIALTRERASKKEITEYVGLENVSLLSAEFAGIRHVLDSIATLDTGHYTDLQDFVDDLKISLKDRIESLGYPQAVYYFVERKVQKVAGYVNSDI